MFYLLFACLLVGMHTRVLMCWEVLHDLLKVKDKVTYPNVEFERACIGVTNYFF